MNSNGVNQALQKPEKECVLELQNIGKNFGGLRAIDNVSQKVMSNEKLAIIGPNGAGKTTLFSIINGDLFPTEGKIILLGKDITQVSNFNRVRMGLSRTFQITSLFWDFSVRENIILALMGTDKRKFSMFRSLPTYSDWFKEVDELLEVVGLSAYQNEIIKTLSYGVQRMVEIALALACKPKILCLDEPNAGLSLTESDVLIDFIKKLPKDITLLLIEHNMDLVFEVVERILVLHDGVMVACDTTEEIRKNVKVQQIYLGDDKCDVDDGN